MAKTIDRLTALKVQKIKTAGYHADGGGLWLQVSGKNAKSWIYRYSLRGRTREMGLGSASRLTLAEARGERDRYNRLVREHVDPIEHRKRQRAEASLADAATITFKEAAAAYTAAHRAGLKNRKSAAQWVSTLATYAEPVIGNLSVRDINTGHIHRILEPIWSTKSVTASNLRGRIEAVLDWAKVKQYRDGENPAQWKGNLDHLLPRPSKVRRVEHLAALPYAELPAFMEKLRRREGVVARALEFTILTAARLGEALNATAQEIDHGAAVWTVPGERMKGGVEHRVPLCKRALELAGTGSGHLFPSRYSADKPISDTILRLLLRELGHSVTIHGFRASFKTWATERTRFDRHTIEAALAHAAGDRIEAAYLRSDVLEKRRALMDAWAQFCATPPAKKADKVVVPLRSA
ncbi:MAG: integrase arm-type DNA-binding domain-containing protein [Xanthobacteraceae bacterium]